MSSPNLGIALLVASQNNKYVTVNDAIDALDGAIAGVFVQAMADADQTPADSDALSCMVIQCTGAMTADRHLILPDSPKLYAIHNLATGGHSIIVETLSFANTVSIPPVEPIWAGSPATIIGATGAQLVYCDGQNNFYAIN